MAGFDLGKLAQDAQDIFTQGLDKAVDIELGLTPNIDDDRTFYKNGDPNGARLGPSVAGQSGLFNIPNNTLLVVGGVALAGLLAWAVLK